MDVPNITTVRLLRKTKSHTSTYVKEAVHMIWADSDHAVLISTSVYGCVCVSLTENHIAEPKLRKLSMEWGKYHLFQQKDLSVFSLSHLFSLQPKSASLNSSHDTYIPLLTSLWILDFTTAFLEVWWIAAHSLLLGKFPKMLLLRCFC